MGNIEKAYGWELVQVLPYQRAVRWTSYDRSGRRRVIEGLYTTI